MSVGDYVTLVVNEPGEHGVVARKEGKMIRQSAVWQIYVHNEATLRRKLEAAIMGA